MIEKDLWNVRCPIIKGILKDGSSQMPGKLDLPLGRPKSNPKRFILEMEKWTGVEWIPDDGSPGIAFSGHEVEQYDRFRTKIGFHSSVAGNRVLSRLAAERSLKKYKKSYQKKLELI